jgi:hypothetical protein
MKNYRSYEEFTREEIGARTRVGFSLDELDIDTGFAEDFSFNDRDDADDEDGE